MSLRAGLLALALGGAALAACGHDQTLQARPSGYGLYFNDRESSVSLAYGVGESDVVALMLECAKGSGAVEVSDLVRDKPADALTLSSSGRSVALSAVTERSESSEPLVIKAKLAARARVLQAFRRSGQISIAYGGVRYGLEATAAERAGVERFFTACQTAA